MSDKRVCNYCGKELDLFDLQEDFSIHRQHIGYGSIHDGDNVDLQLCCDCFDKLVSECNVSQLRRSMTSDESRVQQCFGGGSSESSASTSLYGWRMRNCVDCNETFIDSSLNTQVSRLMFAILTTVFIVGTELALSMSRGASDILKPAMLGMEYYNGMEVNDIIVVGDENRLFPA